MTERTNEKPFTEVYADALSDCPSDCESNSGNFKNDTVSEDSESDIRPPKSRKRNIILSDSDNELEEEWNEHDITPNLPNYLNIPGATIEFGDAPTISEVTDLFFDKTFFDLVVTQTNLYHSQMKALHKISAKTVPWTEVTTNEIKKFLGLPILMGQTRKSCWKDYWSTDPLVEIPIFRATITRMRFEQILTFFHLNDNTQCIVPQDRLSKIKPLLDYIILKYQAIYIPKQELALDEAMVPFRGRISFRTYNPAKIMKYGILIRMLCESESGYICNFEIYSGQGKKLQETILSILEPYLDCWHHIYQDNYYNSVSTAELLFRRKTLVCGTIRENRGLPKVLLEKSKSLHRGEMTF
ncbi:hypothetical protein ACFW04_011915 [Cataglyphis niger]